MEEKRKGLLIIPQVKVIIILLCNFTVGPGYCRRLLAQDGPGNKPAGRFAGGDSEKHYEEPKSMEFRDRGEF